MLRSLSILVLFSIGLALAAGLFVYAPDHVSAGNNCPVSAVSKSACLPGGGLLSLLSIIGVLFALSLNRNLLSAMEPEKQYYNSLASISNLSHLKLAKWLSLREKHDPALG